MPMPKNRKQRYSWRPSLPDHRDWEFSRDLRKAVPSSYDMRNDFPDAYAQGRLGSCTANSTAALVEFYLKKAHDDWTPSRLFIYYNTRDMEGTIKRDAGGTNRDAMKAVAKFGAPPETMWPYEVAEFKKKPSKKVYKTALRTRFAEYRAIDNTSAATVKAAIAGDLPVVAGFSVYESFESAEVTRTGIVPMPDDSEQLLGGHSVLIVGYDDSNDWYVVRNSWGADWGDKGYFYIPYNYFSNRRLASDFWTAPGLRA